MLGTPGAVEQNPGDTMHDRKEVALERLEDQIQWYDRQSAKNQNYYKGLNPHSSDEIGFLSASGPVL